MKLLTATVIISVALALPAAIYKKSWPWFFAALILSFLVVMLPLFSFFASAFLVPDWKGGCAHGWLDCFHEGKFALAPLALLATAALYAVEVLRVPNRTEKWIVLGIFSGAIIAVVCLVFGLVCVGTEADSAHITILMGVPLYVAVWYSCRAVQLTKESGLGAKEYLGTLLGTLPFWIGSIWWSKGVYAALPDAAPGCFIVTAAGRGHKNFVGPFFNLQRYGRVVRANGQLITFWTFENRWQHCAPRSHAYFRRWYNRLGPVVAAQIRSPLLADLVYVAIKPVELAARLANSTMRHLAESQPERGVYAASTPLCQDTLKRAEARAPKQVDLEMHLNTNEN